MGASTKRRNGGAALRDDERIDLAQILAADVDPSGENGTAHGGRESPEERRRGDVQVTAERDEAYWPRSWTRRSGS